jgi:hypothetical protein
MDYYLRWVQYAADDPLLDEFRRRGYPVRLLDSHLENRAIVGFPSSLPIVSELGSKLVVAENAPMELQFAWIDCWNGIGSEPRGAITRLATR